MILIAFVCFAVLIAAWLLAPGLDRPARVANPADAATESLVASARPLA